MGSKRKDERKFQSSLRQRLNMAEPENAIADAWTQMEQALAQLQPELETLRESAGGDPDIGDTVTAIVKAFETAVIAVEAAETALVEAGVLEDDDLLEPDDHGPDA